MAKTIRVEVTAEDIEEGEPQESAACPIALACKRAGLVMPTFWPSDSKLCFGGGERQFVYLPEMCGAFARAFDSFARVEPFSFDLELP